jgi:hypothetical protein
MHIPLALDLIIQRSFVAHSYVWVSQLSREQMAAENKIFI